MTRKHTHTSNKKPATAEIESAIALLDAGDTIGTDVPDELLDLDDADIIEEPISDDEITAAGTEIERQENKQKAYKKQDADGTDVTIAAEPAKKARKAKSKDAAPAAAKVKIERSLEALPEETFRLVLSDKPTDAVRLATLALRPTAKKIAEKFDNLFVSLAAGKTPSVYVMDAIRLLKAETSFNSTELVAHFLKSYQEGTARSQAQQICALFKATKIVVESGKRFELNSDSVIAASLLAKIT